MLSLRGPTPTPDFSLVSDAQGVLQGVVGFSLVQADLGTPLHGGVQRPVDHEEGALDAADFAQRRGEVVTARVGGQLAQDQTRGDRAYRAAIIFRDAAGRPTSQAKGVRQAPGHPTGTGSFERFRKNWWGVRARRQADSRIPSNGAVFSARQSLHMRAYRKLGGGGKPASLAGFCAGRGVQ